MVNAEILVRQRRKMISTKKFVVLVVTLALVAISFAYVFAGELQSSFHGVGVLKSADRFASVGDLVTYEIRVYNPSDYDLRNINVTDTMLGFNDTIPFMHSRLDWENLEHPNMPCQWLPQSHQKQPKVTKSC
ncbi:hypothetical protein GWO13_08940 [Candidatus Bathyarchaeota archaeon]|nr:hypothetical protein [Candidatus Bathyarchaeota archaeon]